MPPSASSRIRRAARTAPHVRISPLVAVGGAHGFAWTHCIEGDVFSSHRAALPDVGVLPARRSCLARARRSATRSAAPRRQSRNSAAGMSRLLLHELRESRIRGFVPPAPSLRSLGHHRGTFAAGSMGGPPTVRDPVTPSAVAVRECAHRMSSAARVPCIREVERSRTRGLVSSLPRPFASPRDLTHEFQLAGMLSDSHDLSCAAASSENAVRQPSRGCLRPISALGGDEAMYARAASRTTVPEPARRAFFSPLTEASSQPQDWDRLRTS